MTGSAPGFKRKLEELRTILPEEVLDTLHARRYYVTLPEESPETLAERQKAQQEDRELDDKFDEAAQIVVRHREASGVDAPAPAGHRLGPAGRIIDQLEQAGVVGPYVGSKSRKVIGEQRDRPAEAPGRVPRQEPMIDRKTVLTWVHQVCDMIPCKTYDEVTRFIKTKPEGKVVLPAPEIQVRGHWFSIRRYHDVVSNEDIIEIYIGTSRPVMSTWV